ncbi:MAG: hypothetical protein WDO18_15940 [Acidobacteriota bacterium]
MFQPGEYISVDYTRQDGSRFKVGADRKISFAALGTTKSEPLRLEIEEFVECVRTRRAPRVTGTQALAALEVAHAILDKIEEHSRLVAQHVAAVNSDDDFARILNWREPVTVARFSRAAAGAILVHVIAFAAFWFSPAPEYRYRRQVSVHFDTRQAVKIVAPRVVKELTQMAPNQGKVTHELDVRAATEGKPAPRSFQPPAPAGPKDRPLHRHPPSTHPTSISTWGPRRSRRCRTAPPSCPGRQSPSSRWRQWPPAPTGVPANPQLKMPKSTGVEIANAGRAGGGGGGVPSNGDNADPTGLGNMQLLSDPQNIDFKPYMLQVLNLVRRQWFAGDSRDRPYGPARGHRAAIFGGPAGASSESGHREYVGNHRI